MPRVLMSVYDKSDLIEFANVLINLGWEIVASGGTEQLLTEAGLNITPVQQLTNLPEMLGGRVKTLHPAIHAGILARSRGDDLDEISQYGYAPINMVVCNLYPFKNTIQQANVTLQDAIEQIDIGGVTLLRGAAKNFLRVTTICDPADYGRVAASLKALGEVDLGIRRDLAVKAFAHTRDYDTAIHAYLAKDNLATNPETDLEQNLSFALNKSGDLRYGENPHQIGGYYSRISGEAPLGAEQFGGKQLSYNNILDVDAAWRTISSYEVPTVVIVKHLTPTGIASARNLVEAFPLALASDEVSAFGGIIAVNRTVDEAFVNQMGALFVEAIAAPDFTEQAIELLNRERKNCRVLRLPHFYAENSLDIRSVHRGILVQRIDIGDPENTIFKTVTDRAPSDEELNALVFAWKAVQHVKSNAIVLAKSDYTVGIGGGLPSRVDAVALAVQKAGQGAKDAVLASDAFFPFADGIQSASQAGVTAIIQPGGSIRDAQVIAAANEANIAMIFTGIRHFRH